MQKLMALKLTALAAAWAEQQKNPELTKLSFDERLGFLVDAEHLARENARVARCLKEAKLRLYAACVEDIDYSAKRELDKGVIRQLATCRWVHEHQNVVITGMTGTGKTYVACALAQQACRKGFRAVYRRAPRLFEELTLAHADGSYARLLARFAKADVLVIDDWGLVPAGRSRASRPPRNLRGQVRPSVDHHHQPAPDDEVARPPRRSDHRRRGPGPGPPQRPPPGAKGPLPAEAGGRREVRPENTRRRCAPITMERSR
jgi:hypothetical protein